MSDVGLGANLELDITAALRRVDQLGRAIETASAAVIQVDTTSVSPEITRAVEAADTGVVIESDATGVAGEITAAVDAADTGILVDADAGDVTGSIDAAVDNADTGVVVTGDASEITGSITGAVDAADTNVVVTGDASDVTGSVTAAVDAADTNVSVTGGVDPGLQTDVLNLGANIADAADGGRGLGKVLGLLSIGAAGAALRFLADAASDLAESTSKAGVVFGKEFPAIERFATGAADAVGLSTQAAFEAAGTFGNLFQALGTSRAEAARLSPQVVQLAGDLASFNNIGTDEALEKLRSGLVGEIEPLRQLGVSFNALDVEAKAVELGLGGVGRELTEGEKVQARYALIVDQTALAQGDFARTSDGLANQQRILRAEFQNAAAAAGTALLPAFMDIIDAVREILPGLQQFGEDVLPSVGDALANLAPLLGVSADLLVAMAPAIALVADLLASIPDEAIAVGASLLIANRAFGGLGSLVTKIGPALASVPGILRGTASAAPAAASGVGGVGRGVQGLAGSVAALNPLVLAGGLLAASMFKVWSDGRDRAADVEQVVDEMGDSLARVGGEFATVEDAIASFLTGLVDAEGQIQSTSTVLDEIATAGHVFTTLGIDAKTAADLIAGGEPALRKFEAGLGDMNLAQKLSVGLLGELADQSGEAVRAQLAAAAATGDLTGAEERELVALNARGAGTEAYIALLDRSTTRTAEAAARSQEVIDAYDAQATAALSAGDAMGALAESAPTAAFAIGGLTGQTSASNEDLVRLAVSLQDAALSEEDMGRAALLLGTDVASLQAFIESAAGAVDGFVTAGVEGLPAIADAFNDANKDSQVSAQEFINGLLLETTRMSQFIADIATITAEGFEEVAGVLVEQGVETAGLAASELANAARAGNNALLEETQAGIDARDSVIEFSTAYLRDVLGPEYVAVTGNVGAEATDAFGAEFSPAEVTRINTQLAALTLTDEGKKVAIVAATEGADAAREYGKALGLDKKTIDAAIAAGLAIVNNAPVGAAGTAGSSVGTAYGDGVIAGMNERQQRINDKAAQLAVRAAKAARDALEPGSPSRLTARLIGVPFAEGIIAGMDAEAESVVAAAERIVREAAGVAVVAPEVAFAASGAGSASSSTGVGGLEVTFGPGSVVVHATPGMTDQEAREIGVAVIDGAAERLAERRLSIVARTQ